MRRTLFEDWRSAPSLVRKLGAGTLGTLEEDMVLAYGKTLEKNGSPSPKTPFPP